MHESASPHFACTLPAEPRQTWNLFRILRERISYAEFSYSDILQNCMFGSKILYFCIGLWFELKIVTNESLPQINDFTFLSSLPSEHSHSPQIIFVMKITNFVKSAKTSFWAPLTQKCTRVLRTTLLVHYPPSQDRLEDFSQATRSKQSAEPKRHDRGPQDWLPTEKAELLFRHIS